MAVLGYKPLPLGRLFLSLHIPPEPFNRCAASGSGEVAGRPEVCATGWQLRELLAQHPSADALELVHQRRDRERRLVLDQQLSVPHHQQSCSPRRSAPTARNPSSGRRPDRLRASAPVQRRLSFFAAFGNKNLGNNRHRNAVSTSPERWLRHYTATLA